MKLIKLIIVSSLFFVSSTNSTETVNSKFVYLQENKVISPWIASVGNKANWYVPAKEDRLATIGGDLKVAFNDQTKLSGIALQWNSKTDIASFSLSGPIIDLSKIEDAVVLMFDIYIESKVKEPIAVAMGCGDPCKGKVHIRKLLTKQTRKKWLTIPIPLNCFSKNGADLTKINAPFIIETKGKLKIRLKNIQLARSEKSDLGCKKQ